MAQTEKGRILVTKKEIDKIKDSLSALIGLPLQDISRIEATLYLNFGRLIPVKGVILRDENGAVLRDESGNAQFEENMCGEYSLTTLSSMRFVCGNDVVFAKSDIFLPTDEQLNQEDFVWRTFDWVTPGNTIFDELLERHFHGDFSEYVVKNVKVGAFGDLIIAFENDFVLEFFADGSGYSENWRFGETNSTESLIVTSKGIIDDTP